MEFDPERRKFLTKFLPGAVLLATGCATVKPPEKSVATDEAPASIRETTPGSTPTRTPEPAFINTPEVRNLSYFERCIDCGAKFTVDRLEIGERWSGWFEVRSSFPKETVAILLSLSPINRIRPNKILYDPYGWWSWDDRQPFIEIPFAK